MFLVAVRSSRTNGGIIRRNIELHDDEAGTVASMELNPAKARVLLQLALLTTQDPKKIQDCFNRYRDAACRSKGDLRCVLFRWCPEVHPAGRVC